jgi:hypothetical protein
VQRGLCAITIARHDGLFQRFVGFTLGLADEPTWFVRMVACSHHQQTIQFITQSAIDDPN